MKNLTTPELVQLYEMLTKYDDELCSEIVGNGSTPDEQTIKSEEIFAKAKELLLDDIHFRLEQM